MKLNAKKKKKRDQILEILLMYPNYEHSSSNVIKKLWVFQKISFSSYIMN